MWRFYGSATGRRVGLLRGGRPHWSWTDARAFLGSDRQEKCEARGIGTPDRILAPLAAKDLGAGRHMRKALRLESRLWFCRFIQPCDIDRHTLNSVLIHVSAFCLCGIEKG